MSDYGNIGITEAQIDMLSVSETFCREKSSIDKVRSLMTSDLGYDENIWAEMAVSYTHLTLPTKA